MYNRFRLLLGAAQEPRLTASVTNEAALIDGYNLRNEEFPRGKDYYAQLASAAFNRPYWECTEFRKPEKIEEFLSIIPDDYYVTLENGDVITAKGLQLGMSIITDEGILKVSSKVLTPRGYKIDGEIVREL